MRCNTPHQRVSVVVAIPIGAGTAGREQPDFTCPDPIAALRLYARTPGFYLVYDVDGVREGQVLPATIDATDPQRSIIAFPPTDPPKSPSRAERAGAAQRLAEQMKKGESGD